MIDPLEAEVAILNEALELPPHKRAEYLDRACKGDQKLKDQIETLLAAHERADGFLAFSPARAPAHVGGHKEGDRIGRYKLLQRIGEGGCGVVYMAEQEHPVRRRVALKVIRLGMDTERIIARFEAERQALAMMDHPNIAKVFDAGATDSGRPYFVMELVRGIKITDYCEQNNLPTRERLGLFVQVCHAIQHAHQKGIIHRDIKPSNILVTVNDGVPIPKVIDFGIAKGTEGRLTDKTLFTAFEQFIGTPAYMSPEQAAMTSVDIDTRSDIYSLGVLLYELLTGRTPFDGNELLAAGLDEMRRTIREVEPVKPSTRLTQNSGSIPSRPQQTIHGVRGDLDWIVMKCLEKDRARRYETANGLAHDILRHLKNEPVGARPPTGLYRFHKAIRRNKTAFAAAAAVLTVLIAGVIVSTWQAVRAKRAERQQILLRQEAQNANRGLRETVSILELERAEDFFQAGDAGFGAAHLAAILRRNPSNHIAASRLVSALLHRNWALPTGAPLRHGAVVTTLSFSPDSACLLSTSDDNTANLWEAGTGKWIAGLQHDGQVHHANFSPDGTRIVSASADGFARIWNATNGSPFTAPLEHKGPLNFAEFSTDSMRILSAGADKIVRIWDGWTGELLRETAPQRTDIAIARFSPDGKEIVTGSKRGSVRFFDLETAKETPWLGIHYEGITALSYSPDGRRLVSASADGIVRLWSTARKEPIQNAIMSDEPIDHAVFSPDGRLLLTSSHGTAARLWDVNTGKPLGSPLAHSGRVVAGAFSADGQKIVTISKEHSARLWDAQTRLPLCQPIREPQEFTIVTFSPDGKRLATGSKDGTIRLWDIQSRQHTGLAVAFETQIECVALNPDTKFVLGASADGAARVFDIASLNTRHPSSYLLQVPAGLQSAEFSPDGNLVLTATTNKNLYLWDWRARRIIAGPLSTPSRIRSTRFSPDSKRFVTAGFDGTVQVWNAETWQPITLPLSHGSDAVSVAIFSPDGELIASAGEDFTARVWNARTGAPAGKPMIHSDHVKWVDFSPDGTRIATASTDNTARIWDVRTGAPLVPALQHARIVDKALFSHDGRCVITVSMDRTSRIWDAQTGQALSPPLRHHYSVYTAAFSRDGERALTGCWNGVARVWDCNSGQPLTEPLGIPDWNWRLVSFGQSGEQVVTGGRDAILRYWHLPPAPVPAPEWFPAFAEAVAGIRLGPRGNVEYVGRGELEALVERLNSAKADGFYERLARWFLADPAQRQPNPF